MTPEVASAGWLKGVRWFARALCTTVILIVGIYAAIAAAVAFFLATGTLTPGGVMFFDSPAPTLAQALGFAGIGATIVAACAFARHKLGRWGASASHLP